MDWPSIVLLAPVQSSRDQQRKKQFHLFFLFSYLWIYSTIILLNTYYVPCSRDTMVREKDTGHHEVYNLVEEAGNEQTSKFLKGNIR